MNRDNRKFNQVWKAQQWPKIQSHKGGVQLPLGSNQFGRPLRQQLQNTHLRRRRQFPPSLPSHQLVRNLLMNSRIRSGVHVPQINQQQRKSFSPLQKNQWQKKQVRPLQKNHLQRNQVRPLQKIQQQRKARPLQTNQQQRMQIGSQQTFYQQRKQVGGLQTKQQQRQRVRPPQINMRKKRFTPTPPKSRIQQVVNRLKFFTPRELLNLAPQQDRAIWDTIIKRLPNDYSIPDPQFIHIYQSFKK